MLRHIRLQAVVSRALCQNGNHQVNLNGKVAFFPQIQQIHAFKKKSSSLNLFLDQHPMHPPTSRENVHPPAPQWKPTAKPQWKPPQTQWKS